MEVIRSSGKELWSETLVIRSSGKEEGIRKEVIRRNVTSFKEVTFLECSGSAPALKMRARAVAATSLAACACRKRKATSKLPNYRAARFRSRARLGGGNSVCADGAARTGQC